MRRYAVYTFLVILFNVGISFCQIIEEKDVLRIDAHLALLKYKAGNVIIVDAMNSRTYAKYHILGAINLPNDGPKDSEKIEKAHLPFPKDKEIIIYCD